MMNHRALMATDPRYAELAQNRDYWRDMLESMDDGARDPRPYWLVNHEYEAAVFQFHAYRREIGVGA